MTTETAVGTAGVVHDGASPDYTRERLYVMTALALGAITAVEVATYAFPHMVLWGWGGTLGVTVWLLGMMAIKFVTVAYIFMHLKFDKPLLSFAFYSGVVLAIAVFVAVLTTLHVWWPGHH